MTRPIVLQLASLAQHPSFDEIDRHFERIVLQDLNQLSAQQIERVQVLLTSAVTATPASLMDRLPALKAICSVGGRLRLHRRTGRQKARYSGQYHS